MLGGCFGLRGGVLGWLVCCGLLSWTCWRTSSGDSVLWFWFSVVYVYRSALRVLNLVSGCLCLVLWGWLVGVLDLGWCWILCGVASFGFGFGAGSWIFCGCWVCLRG